MESPDDSVRVWLVEIDALVLTSRNGERVLLIVEAHCGTRQELVKQTVASPELAAESLLLDVDHILPVIHVPERIPRAEPPRCVRHRALGSIRIRTSEVIVPGGFEPPS